MNPMLTLAYTLFLGPLPEAVTPPWWVVMIVLIVLISVAYKTVKLPRLEDLPRQVLMMSVQIIAFIVVAALLIWVLTVAA